jgi:pimeloyl-ACP methyl ester carboxylesterase
VQALWCQPKCFRAMADYLLALERDSVSITAIAPPCETPVVVISSRDQPPEWLAAHRRLAEASGDGRHIIAAQSTHWVQFDEPELITAVVKELVESHHDQ